MSTESISVQDLADELLLPWHEVARRVSGLCRELGPTNVVAQAVPNSAECVLTASAADLIRDDLATA